MSGTTPAATCVRCNAPLVNAKCSSATCGLNGRLTGGNRN